MRDIIGIDLRDAATDFCAPPPDNDPSQAKDVPADNGCFCKDHRPSNRCHVIFNGALHGNLSAHDQDVMNLRAFLNCEIAADFHDARTVCLGCCCRAADDNENQKEHRLLFHVFSLYVC